MWLRLLCSVLFSPRTMRVACLTSLLLTALSLCGQGAAAAPQTQRDDAARMAQAVLRAAQTQQKAWAPLQRDADLDTVARKNSAALAEVKGPIPEAASAYLRHLLERHHVREAVVEAFSLRIANGETLPAALDEFIATRHWRFTHFGVGTTPAYDADDGVVATVLLTRRLLTVDHLQTAPQRPLTLCFRMVDPATARNPSPTVVMTTPSGRTLRQAARAQVGKRGHLCVQWPGQGPGRYQLEVNIDGPHGPEVAALFPLYVGVAPPDKPTDAVFPPSDDDAATVEKTLLGLINKSRKKAKVPPIALWPALVRSARAHSEDMLAQGFFGHVSPTTGDLEKRLQQLAIAYDSAAENLAIATSAHGAHTALLGSPSHRETLLNHALTHVGIGVARSPAGLLYVTQCFARLIR